MQLHVLHEADLRELLDMPAAIEVVREGFQALWRGKAEAPLRTVVEVEGGSTLFMPSRVASPGALGLKVVSVRTGNGARGLPTIHGVVLLVDPETGAPEALLDAGWLTALRTGAASGVATDLLARPDARVLAVVGAGAQARTQIEGVAAVRDLEEIRVVSRTGRSARRLADELEAEGVLARVRVVASADAAVEGADVVVTATDAVEPVLRPGSVDPGTHVNAVGSYRPDMRELPPELLGRARVVVDQVEAALAEAGEVCAAIEEGWLPVDDIAEIGAVLAGDRPGRESPDEITLFKSVGNAVQDLAVAGLALRRFREAVRIPAPASVPRVPEAGRPGRRRPRR